MKLEEKYREPFQAWQRQPGPTESGALLSAVTPVINTALRTYGGEDAGPVLRGRARRIVLDALPRYDPAKAGLGTFLMQHLQGLRRARAETGDIIHLPEQLRIEQQQLAASEKELRDRLGRDPSTPELSDHLGLSPIRLGQLRRASAGVPEGVLTGRRPGGEEDDDFAPAVASGLPEARARAEFVYHGLDPHDQLILEHSLGLFGRPVLDNNTIARRLGISASAVSQRRARVQQQLNAADDLEVV